jgi:Transcriptional regulator
VSNHTKQLLGETLKTLMTKKSLRKITIQELVDTCGVNRQTFYYHFHDIYELLGWIYQVEAINEISTITYDSWCDEITVIVNYLYENRKFCYATYRSLGKDSLDRFLLKVFDDMTEKVLSGIERAALLTPEDRLFITRLYGYALSGTLLDWVASKFSTPPEQRAYQVCHSIKGTLASMVEKFI